MGFNAGWFWFAGVLSCLIFGWVAVVMFVWFGFVAGVVLYLDLAVGDVGLGHGLWNLWFLLFGLLCL